MKDTRQSTSYHLGDRRNERPLVMKRRSSPQVVIENSSNESLADFAQRNILFGDS